MGPPKYTWENCRNVTADPLIDPEIWFSMIDIMYKNGNHEFDRDFLPPMFCDPENYVPPDRGKALLIFDMVTAGVAFLVVLGRFLTRIFVAGRIGWDDWTIVLAVIIMWATCGVTTHGIVNGAIGKHVYDASIPELTVTLKVMFIHILLYSLNVFMVKASLLFFYKRLFPPSWRRMQWCLSGAIVILFFYAVASCLVSVFHCNPIPSFWIISMRYSGCPSLGQSVTVFSGIRVVGVVFDGIVILLPMKFLWSLKLPLRQRLGLACVFGMGIIALGAAMVRLIYQPRAWRSLDVGWNFAVIAFAAQLEYFFAIVTASIPALTALFHKSRNRNPINTPQTTLGQFSSQSDQRYMSSESLQLTETTPKKFMSDLQHKQLQNRPMTPKITRAPPPPHTQLNSYTSGDFLTWAYDPERKNGNWGNGNYANAYGEYTMNNPQRRGGNIFSEIFRSWIPRTTTTTGNDDGEDGGGRAGGSGVGSAVESNENLVKVAHHGRTGSINVGGIGPGGQDQDGVGLDVNQIVMTSEVVVKVSRRR